MFPMPKILNTSKLPVDELAMLKAEVALGNYYEIKYNTSGWQNQPNTIANLYTFMYGIAGATGGLAGTMYGTAYGDFMTQDSSYVRAYQHCFPTQTLYNYYSTVTDTPVIMRRTAIGPHSGFPSLTRNGYTSNSYGASNYPSVQADLFVYYDASTGFVMQYNPSTLSTPTRYY